MEVSSVNAPKDENIFTSLNNYKQAHEFKVGYANNNQSPARKKFLHPKSRLPVNIEKQMERFSNYVESIDYDYERINKEKRDQAESSLAHLNVVKLQPETAFSLP